MAQRNLSRTERDAPDDDECTECGHVDGGVPGCTCDACGCEQECGGHESLNGADMGRTVWCDGSCR
jgi:hypothetical protein